MGVQTLHEEEADIAIRKFAHDHLVRREDVEVIGFDPDRDVIFMQLREGVIVPPRRWSAHRGWMPA